MDISTTLVYLHCLPAKGNSDAEGTVMDIGSTIFTVYFIGAVVVGIFLLREVEFGSESSFKKKGQKLGPEYWGRYAGSQQETEAMKTIEPPAPSKDSVGGLSGGGTYSGGRAVTR